MWLGIQQWQPGVTVDRPGQKKERARSEGTGRKVAVQLGEEGRLQVQLAVQKGEVRERKARKEAREKEK